MAVLRPQDKTRFRKTYSFAKQSPVQRTTVDMRTFDVFSETADTMVDDASRMRKTYPSNRQQPINLGKLPTFPPLEIISITPPSGSYLGGTFVIIEVNYTYGATQATVGGLPITSFTIIDHTHISGYTQAFPEPITGEDDVELETEDGEIITT